MKTIRARMLTLATMALTPGVALAQTPTTDRMVGAICAMVGPLVGQNSKFLSLVFLVALGAMIFLWWMSENKEGVLIWVLRAGIALGVLINIMTLPNLVGLPNPCGGG